VPETDQENEGGARDQRAASWDLLSSRRHGRRLCEAYLATEVSVCAPNFSSCLRKGQRSETAPDARLRGDDEQGGVAYADFRSEILGRH
jgi:hypothetical protein